MSYIKHLEGFNIQSFSSANELFIYIISQRIANLHLFKWRYALQNDWPYFDMKGRVFLAQAEKRGGV